MAFSERELRAAIRLIAEAPYDPRLWTEALALIAQAGGGWAGQLIGIANGAPTFDVTSGFTNEANAKLHAYGGYDPARNPRMAIAFRLAVEGGRLAYESGLMGPRDFASPSTPVVGTPFWHAVS